MIQKQDNTLALFCGIDIPIIECKLIIHQPSIKDISYIGEKAFFTGVQTICVQKTLLEQDNSLLSELNNFQIFMTIMSQKETLDKKNAVQQVMSLFFPNYKVNFTPRSIIFVKDTEIITIDETNFNSLQEIVTEICCLRSNLSGSNGVFNPGNDAAAEIAKKLMRGRERIAAQKNESHSSIFAQHLSSLIIGTSSLTMKDAIELTIFQLYDQIERYSLYVSWDLDLKSRLAGGKSDNSPDNWMKNIH